MFQPNVIFNTNYDTGDITLQWTSPFLAKVTAVQQADPSGEFVGTWMHDWVEMTYNVDTGIPEEAAFGKSGTYTSGFPNEVFNSVLLDDNNTAHPVDQLVQIRLKGYVGNDPFFSVVAGYRGFWAKITNRTIVSPSPNENLYEAIEQVADGTGGGWVDGTIVLDSTDSIVWEVNDQVVEVGTVVWVYQLQSYLSGGAIGDWRFSSPGAAARAVELVIINANADTYYDATIQTWDYLTEDYVDGDDVWLKNGNDDPMLVGERYEGLRFGPHTIDDDTRDVVITCTPPVDCGIKYETDIATGKRGKIVLDLSSVAGPGLAVFTPEDPTECTTLEVGLSCPLVYELDNTIGINYAELIGFDQDPCTHLQVVTHEPVMSMSICDSIDVNLDSLVGPCSYLQVIPVSEAVDCSYLALDPEAIALPTCHFSYYPPVSGDCAYFDVDVESLAGPGLYVVTDEETGCQTLGASTYDLGCPMAIDDGGKLIVDMDVLTGGGRGAIVPTTTVPLECQYLSVNEGCNLKKVVVGGGPTQTLDVDVDSLAGQGLVVDEDGACPALKVDIDCGLKFNGNKVAVDNDALIGDATGLKVVTVEDECPIIDTKQTAGNKGCLGDAGLNTYVGLLYGSDELSPGWYHLSASVTTTITASSSCPTSGDTILVFGFYNYTDSVDISTEFGAGRSYVTAGQASTTYHNGSATICVEFTVPTVVQIVAKLIAPSDFVGSGTFEFSPFSGGDSGWSWHSF